MKEKADVDARSLWRKISEPAYYTRATGEELCEKGNIQQYERVENEDEDGPKIVRAHPCPGDESLPVDYRIGIVNGPENLRAHIDYTIKTGVLNRRDKIAVKIRFYDENQNEVETSSVEVETKKCGDIDERVRNHAETVLGNYSWMAGGK